MYTPKNNFYTKGGFGLFFNIINVFWQKISSNFFFQKEFPSSRQHLNTLINSSSISSSALPRFNKISPQQSLLIPSYYSSSSLDRRALKGKKK